MLPPLSFVMARSISLSHLYDAPADLVWALVTDLEALAVVNHPRVVMTGLPTGRIFQGQQIEVRVSVFGILPKQPYAMEVVVCDDMERQFQSREYGAGVKSWEHRLQVLETAAGCRIEETITLDAGWLTPLFAAWARYLYKARHPARLRLLHEASG